MNGLREGVQECCDYRKDVNISIEYKIKEPRNFSYPSTMAVILLMLEKLGRETAVNDRLRTCARSGRKRGGICCACQRIRQQAAARPHE